MIALLILVLILTALLLTTAFVLGHHLGDYGQQDELAQLRLQASEARRRLHQATRDAFVALAVEAERQRQRGR